MPPGLGAYEFHTHIVLGALLGTQNGREVEIVNTFELATEGTSGNVDHGFLVSRRDQCTLATGVDLRDTATNPSLRLSR